MRRTALTVEHVLYLLILLLAACLRFYRLGTAPLSDNEATLALQALRASQMERGQEALTLAPQPGYTVTTGLLFFLFSSSDFMARAVSAVCGALMAGLPFFFRKQLGRRNSLLVALGIAIDPGLVTASRLAGGPAPAIFLSLLAIHFWQDKKPAWAGVSAGLASLFGSAFVHGALIAAATWLILYRKQRPLATTHDSEETPKNEGEQLPYLSKVNQPLQQFALFALGSIILGSTAFLLFPEGLADWLNTWMAYFQGWFQPEATPAVLPLAALCFYEALAFLLAIMSLLHQFARLGTHGTPLPMLHRVAYTWAGIGMALTWLYPGRQVMDITWVIIPLWILACNELENLLPARLHIVSLIHAILVLVLTGLLWNTLISPIQAPAAATISWVWIRLVVIIGILSLIALISTLVYLAYNWELSRVGLSLGMGSFLFLYTISTMWGASQVRMNLPQELWTPGPATGQVGLFLDTVHDLSRWNRGTETDLEVLYTVSSPALTWYLREFRNARYVNHLPEMQQPPVVITTQESQVTALAATYRGQDFVWWIRPGWGTVLPPDLVRWLAFKEAPLFQEEIILWARSDLFPGGSLENALEVQNGP